MSSFMSTPRLRYRDAIGTPVEEEEEKEEEEGPMAVEGFVVRLHQSVTGLDLS